MEALQQLVAQRVVQREDHKAETDRAEPEIDPLDPSRADK
jgi:hypothetical protein